MTDPKIEAFLESCIASAHNSVEAEMHTAILDLYLRGYVLCTWNEHQDDLSIQITPTGALAMQGATADSLLKFTKPAEA